MTLLDSPSPREIKLAVEWHGGQSSALYAVASTGSLSSNAVSGHYVTQERRDAGLLYNLWNELGEVVRALEGTPYVDADSPYTAEMREDLEVARQWLDRVNLLETAASDRAWKLEEDMGDDDTGDDA